MPDNLDDARDKIDKIDNEILNLLDKRAKLALETNDINQTKLSRLSCQIELKEEFNNITVTMTIPRTLT